MPEPSTHAYSGWRSYYRGRLMMETRSKLDPEKEHTQMSQHVDERNNVAAFPVSDFPAQFKAPEGAPAEPMAEF
jgi:hypothetical protein